MFTGGVYAYCACGGLVRSKRGSWGAMRLQRPRASGTAAAKRWGTTRSQLGAGPVPNDSVEEEESGKREAVELFRAEEVETNVSGGRREELPLFPLQVVLNPGTEIPLYIFELRYRLLFNRIHDGDSRFGVVMYDKDEGGLARVGCAAELTRFEPLPDGRIMTDNRGIERFRILRIIEEEPYIRAEVEFLQDDPPQEDCEQLEQSVWTALQDVLRLSNKLYDKVLDLSPEIKRLAPHGPEAQSIASARRMQDFSFAVSQILDMPLREQQLLLQMRDTGKRLKRQCKMLDSARQYLAAQVTIKNAGLPEW